MKNINESYNIGSLTKDEVKTLLESLLFASSVDVGASFYKEETIKMFDLAKKIRSYFPDVILEDITVTPVVDQQNNVVYYDEHTEEMIKFFPELYQDLKVS